MKYKEKRLEVLVSCKRREIDRYLKNEEIRIDIEDMRGIIPLLIWRGYLVVFLAPTGADVKRQSFAELYEAGSRVIASVVTPVSTKTTPSLLSCMHACVRGKKCAGFNYCRTQTKKDEHNCEMFETDRFMNDKDKTIKPYEDCSIYLLNKVDNQPLAQKVRYYT